MLPSLLAKSDLCHKEGGVIFMPVAGEFTKLVETAHGMKIAVLPFARTSRLNVILWIKGAGGLDEFIPEHLVPKAQRKISLTARWGKGNIKLVYHPNIDHAVEHLVFKGCKKGKFDTPSKIMKFFRQLDYEDEVGTGADTMPLWVRYYLELSPRDLRKAIEFLAELTLRPKFLEKDPATRKRMQDELDKEKRVMLEEWAWQQDDLLTRVEEEVRLQMFPGHPLGYPLGGDKDDILNTTLSQIIARHRMRYHPSNMELVVVGGGTSSRRVKRLAEQYFRAPRRKIHPIHVPEPKFAADTSPKVTYEETQPAKSYIGIGFRFRRPALPREEATRQWLSKQCALWLLRKPFGGRWVSRPSMELREKKGIGYRFPGLLEEFPGAGALILTTHTFPDNVKKVVATLLRIFKKLATKPLGKKELEDAKKSWSQKFDSDAEQPSDIAEFLYMALRMRGKIITYRQIKRAMQAITPQDVLAVAQEVIAPENLKVRIIGKPLSARVMKEIDKIVANWKIKTTKDVRTE